MRRTLVCAIALLLALPASSGAGRGSDPYLDQQWGLVMIDASAAWKKARGAGTLIAVLDSGVDLTHPDLAANIAGPGYDAIRDEPGADDARGHGTWVAGLAAAVGGNGKGISGVAPAARILPVRVCTGGCPGEAVATGIRYATRRGADVINMSFYVPTTDPAIGDVLDAVAFAQRKGVVVVAGAGNNAEPWCTQPAASTLCVGATDRWDLKTHYSNGDAVMASDYLVAPGGSVQSCEEMVLSTALPGIHPCGPGGRYTATFGTSGAAPHVSGVAALLAGMGSSADEIVDCILSSTDDLGPDGRDPVYGYGRLNAAAAVRCAA